MKTTLSLLAILVASTAAEDSCPRETAPVCGSDGNTYLNQCTIDLIAPHSGITLAHPGKCSPCECHDVIYPVCANDGNTYKNPCEMLCKNDKLMVKYPGLCKCDCPMTYEPVCGSDGRTYGDRCVFGCLAKAHNVTIVKEGNC